MKWLVIAGALLLRPAVEAFAAEFPAAANPQPALSDQLLREEKHFLQCLAVVYHPAFWISYNGALYFQAKDESQVRQLEAMKAARSNYVALTDTATRHQLVVQALSEGGVPDNTQRKILLPYSETNPNLTPTLPKLFRVLPRYSVVKELGGGDALLKEDDAVYFVMDFGHGAADGSGTNACLVREGTKVYTTAEGEKKTVAAFTDVGLSRDEIALLVRASAGFRKKAEAVAEELATSKSRHEFADSLARANDRNPFLQYQVAMAYLEGKGTAKDQKLGLEWMRRAAQNGSGDAKAYLEQGQK